ncbi:MAG: hypothetical protein ACXVCY_04155 [Pseudobdellovibrionaceae bacterium]
MQSQVLSGARMVFKLANKPVGYALGVNVSAGINYQPVSVLGHLEVVEHVPVAYQVEMSASMARIATASRLAGYENFPGLRSGLEGGVSSPQIIPAFGEDGMGILTSGEMTSTLQDLVTKKSLYTVSGVKGASKNFEISPGSVVGEQCSFVARILNEDGENVGSIGA